MRGPQRTRKRVLVPGKLIVNGTNRARTSEVDLGNEVVADLKNLLRNNDLPAAARVTAARTLAEIEGLIGRHQASPERPDQPLHSLSRDALIAELERLRTLIKLPSTG